MTQGAPSAEFGSTGIAPMAAADEGLLLPVQLAEEGPAMPPTCPSLASELPSFRSETWRRRRGREKMEMGEDLGIGDWEDLWL